MSSPAPRPPPPRTAPSAPRAVAASASPSMYRSQQKPVTIPRAPPGARPRAKGRKTPEPAPVDEETMRNPMAAKAVTLVAKLWRGINTRRRVRSEQLVHFYRTKMFVRMQCALRAAGARAELKRRRAARVDKAAARNAEYTNHVLTELQHVWHWERSSMLRAAQTIQAVYRWYKAKIAFAERVASMDAEAAEAAEPPMWPIVPTKKRVWIDRTAAAVDRPWAPRECIATTQTAETALVVAEVKPTKRKAKALEEADEVISYGEVMWINNKMRATEADKLREKEEARDRAAAINQGALVSQDMDDCAAMVQRRFRIHKAKGEVSSRKVLGDYRYERARTVQCAVRAFFARETRTRLAYAAANRCGAKNRQYAKMLTDRVANDILWNRHELERAAMTIQRAWRWSSFDEAKAAEGAGRPAPPPYGLLEGTRSHSPRAKRGKAGAAAAANADDDTAAAEEAPAKDDSRRPQRRADGPAPTRLDVGDRLSSVSRLVADSDDPEAAELTVSAAGTMALSQRGAEVWVLDPEDETAAAAVADAYVELLPDGRLALFTKEGGKATFVEGWSSEPVADVSHCVVVAAVGDDGAGIDVIRADGSIGWSTREARIEPEDEDAEAAPVAAPAATTKKDEGAPQQQVQEDDAPTDKSAAAEKKKKDAALQVVIKIVKAENVSTEGEDAPDTYCVVRLDEQKFQTEPVEDKANPVWNAETTFTVTDAASDAITIRLWDEDVFSDDKLASATVGLSSANLVDGTFVAHKVRMTSEESEAAGGKPCYVFVELKAVGFSTAATAKEEQPAPVQDDDAASQDKAALKIQSVQRQRTARAETDRLRAEAAAAANSAQPEETAAAESAPVASASPDDASDDDTAAKDQAALKIQTVQRQRAARAEADRRRAVAKDAEPASDDVASQDKAALKIQSVQRQRMARAETDRLRAEAAAAATSAQAEETPETAPAASASPDDASDDDTAAKDQAALKIQTVQRQRAARAEADRRRADAAAAGPETTTGDAAVAPPAAAEADTANADAEDRAATTIQSVHRQRAAKDETDGLRASAAASPAASASPPNATSDEDRAALAIQSTHRQRAAKEEAERLRATAVGAAAKPTTSTNSTDEDRAALAIQSTHRQRAAKEEADTLRAAAAKSAATASEEDQAALKIQTAQRQRAAKDETDRRRIAKEEEGAGATPAAARPSPPSTPPPGSKWELVIKIVKATGVSASGEKPDTYCVVRLGEQKFQTEPVDDKADPVWNAETTFTVANLKTDELIVRLWDEDTFNDDRLASATLKIGTAGLVDGEFVSRKVMMHKEEDTAGARCDVYLELKAVGFSTK